MVHPFSPDWYVGGSVLVWGRSSSIVVIARFQLHQFTVSIKELAEWFGLEVARLVVDECLAQRGAGVVSRQRQRCVFVLWECLRDPRSAS
jgi:hypothetical protein